MSLVIATHTSFLVTQKGCKVCIFVQLLMKINWESQPSATKLRQGNIFTSVCQEFCPQGGVCLSACWDTLPWADTPHGQNPPPPPSAC